MKAKGISTKAGATSSATSAVGSAQALAGPNGLVTPAELYVPLVAAGRSGAMGSVRAPLAGTAVRAGDPLVRDAGGGGAMPTGVALPRAPLAGTVVGERVVRLTNGAEVQAAVLRPDTFTTDLGPRLAGQGFTERLREILGADAGTRSRYRFDLAAAGVQVDRPSSPDLYEQLARAVGVDTVMVTVLDTDAHLSVCARLTAESAPDLVAGGVMLARATGAKRLLIVLEPTVSDRTRRELTRLTEECGKLSRALDVALEARTVSYTNAYPMGEATMLARRVLDRRLKPGHLPTTEQFVLVDAACAVAAGRVVRHGQTLTHVPIGLFDHIAGQTSILRVPVGTPISALVPRTDVALRIGDVLQERVTSRDAVLTASDLYLHVLELDRKPPPDPCIRCGWCVEACPTRVHPASVLEAAQTRDPEMARRAGVEACIDCGICQYVCPSRLPLLTALRFFTRPVEAHKAGGAA